MAGAEVTARSQEEYDKVAEILEDFSSRDYEYFRYTLINIVLNEKGLDSDILDFIFLRKYTSFDTNFVDSVEDAYDYIAECKFANKEQAKISMGHLAVLINFAIKAVDENTARLKKSDYKARLKNKEIVKSLKKIVKKCKRFGKQN